MMLRVAVIGGGIGGLTAAVALLQAGFEVEVYEQAPELTEVGGGINMAPNATRVLRGLGLAKGLDREGVRPLGTHQRRWQDGRTLQRAPLNPLCEELYGGPHMTIHRADLLSGIAAAFPAERVHLGHRLVGLANRGDSAEAWFDNGVRITADVLVGADGIHSAVHAALFGAEAPDFAGCVAYRGLVPAERIADLGLELGSQSWVGPGAHFVHYFVSRGQLLNFVGWTEHDEWNREDWTDRATVARALAAFESWHEQVRTIIAAAETCFIWALFDRDPLPAGRSAARHYWATPATRCTRSWAKARQWRSRTARRSRPVCARSRIPPRHCSNTSACVCRVSSCCRRCRAPTRSASICRTDWRSSCEMPNGPGRATARPTRCAGSTTSTLPPLCQSRRE
jgi:2-polyprenyl-6-methoxyphenol hydroxylase-like FAD-dependent oxidoreductase